MLSVYAVLY